MKDWRGTEVEVGSRVIYPSRRGSSMYMREGTVVSFSEKEVVKFSGAHWWDRTIKIRHDSGKIVVPAAERVTVIEKVSSGL